MNDFFSFILKFLFVCFVIGIFSYVIYTSIEDSENNAVHNNFILIKEKEGKLIFFDKRDGCLIVVDKEYNIEKVVNFSEEIEEYYE